MCLWRLEIMAGEDNWTAFTQDVIHSEALQWVHNCCHPGMPWVLEDKRVTAVIVLDTAVYAENTINPVHLASFLWPYRWTLWMRIIPSVENPAKTPIIYGHFTYSFRWARRFPTFPPRNKLSIHSLQIPVTLEYVIRLIDACSQL